MFKDESGDWSTKNDQKLAVLGKWRYCSWDVIANIQLNTRMV